jgi:uncharacterized protein (TIGR02996 family)
MSRSLVLDFPDCVQPNNFWCWPCCAFAAGQWWDVGPKELNEWAKVLNTSKKYSTDPEAVAAYFSDELHCEVQYRQYMSIDDLRKFAEKQWPVLLAVTEYMSGSGVKANEDYGHCLTSLFVGDRWLLCQDPSQDNVARPKKNDSINAPGRVVITEKNFLENWKDRDYFRTGIAIGPKKESIRKTVEHADKPIENTEPAEPSDAEKFGRLSGEQLKFADAIDRNNLEKVAKRFESEGFHQTASFARLAKSDPEDATKYAHNDLRDDKKSTIFVKSNNSNIMPGFVNNKYNLFAHLYWPQGQKPFASLSVAHSPESRTGGTGHIFGHMTHDLRKVRDVLQEHGATQGELAPLDEMIPQEFDYRPNEMMPEDYYTMSRLSGEQIKFAMHPDHEAFHRAIAANPNDPATKLIYADWLEENHRPALAELIRLHESGRDPEEVKTVDDTRPHDHGAIPYDTYWPGVDGEDVDVRVQHLRHPVNGKYARITLFGRNKEENGAMHYFPIVNHATKNLGFAKSVIDEDYETVPHAPLATVGQIALEPPAKLSRLSSAQLQFARDPNRPRKFASTQINLPPKLAEKLYAIAAKIPDSDLADDGRDDESHITICWGLEDDKLEPIKELVEGFGPIKINLGKISLFHNKEKEFDVVKVDVDSPDLKRLNKLITDNIEHHSTHDSYIPHSTIAYVKPGSGDSLVGQHVGGYFVAKSFLFCPKDQSAKIEIQLGEAEKKVAKLSKEQIAFAMRI